MKGIRSVGKLHGLTPMIESPIEGEGRPSPPDSKFSHKIADSTSSGNPEEEKLDYEDDRMGDEDSEIGHHFH